MIKNFIFIFFTFITVQQVQQAHATISDTVKIGNEEQTFYPKRSALMEGCMSIKESKGVLKALDNATKELNGTRPFVTVRETRSHTIAGMTEISEVELRYMVIPTPQNGFCAWAALGVAPTQETILGLIDYYDNFSKRPNLTANDEALLSTSVTELCDMLLTEEKKGILSRYDLRSRIDYLRAHNTSLANNWFQHIQALGGSVSTINSLESRGRAPENPLALQYFAQLLGIRIVTLQEMSCNIRQNEKNPEIFQENVYTGPESTQDTQILRKFLKVSDIVPQNAGHILPTLYRLARVIGDHGEQLSGHFELAIPVEKEPSKPTQGVVPIPVPRTGLDTLQPKENVPIPVLLTGIDALLKSSKSFKKETLEDLKQHQRDLKSFLEVVEISTQNQASS